ncbi:MAG: hypothetical protein P8Y70_07070 [Candidatus Lokiarchaeota archaeon]
MNEKDDKEKMSSLFRKAAENKDKRVAKEKVNLTHVETKKQEASQETIDLAKRLKEQVITHDSFEKLSNDELTIIESIMNKRMFLSRIAIISNQSRVPMGKEPFKKAELEEILSNLIAKGYIASEIVGNNRVYYLTERGKYRVQ